VTVLAYGDLGIHCTNQDFSEPMVLPTLNTLHAQVTNRGGEEPKILTQGVSVHYTIPGNGHTKTVAHPHPKPLPPNPREQKAKEETQ